MSHRAGPAYDVIRTFFLRQAQQKTAVPQTRGGLWTRKQLPLRPSSSGSGSRAVTSPPTRQLVALRHISSLSEWSRGIARQHAGPSSGSAARRWQSTSADNGSDKCSKPDCPRNDEHKPTHAMTTTSSKPVQQHPHYLSSLPASIRKLALSLPSPPGRPPSRDQLLALTSSFFERLRIRFKWATIRSYRRFRADDYSAFFSFGILGTVGWVLLSTTSFLAFCFFIVNSLSLQEWLARKLGSYLTAHTGITIVFESAIVPKWGLFGGSSRILFKNVYVSRGPPKNSQGEMLFPDIVDPEALAEEQQKVSKWTHFHLMIDTVEVTLSLRRWLDGNGIVKDANVRGVRGVIDRSHIQPDPTAPKNRFAFRHTAKPGDFWLEQLQLEDFLVTVYQPYGFRPWTFSVFKADINKLRKQWLFYDLMSADSITGQVDNCLFSLHKPQSIGRTSEQDLQDVQWARMSRFRIDGVPIDHLQSPFDTGVLSWVTSGRLDLVADIRFPRDESSLDLSAIVADIVDKFDSSLQEIGQQLSSGGKTSAKRDERIPGQRSLSKDALQAPKDWNVNEEKSKLNRTNVTPQEEVQRDTTLDAGASASQEEDKRVLMDLDIRFKDLKASVPYFTSDLSYVNNALIRPIVAFINSHKTLIPIRCHLDLPLSEFDGSWTTYDVGILDRLSEQVYAALAHHVSTSHAQRLQTVSLWTLQVTVQAMLNQLKHTTMGAIQPAIS